MKSQKMKSSKYTQAGLTISNKAPDFSSKRDYENVGMTILSNSTTADDGITNPNIDNEIHCHHHHHHHHRHQQHFNANNSAEHLINSNYENFQMLQDVSLHSTSDGTTANHQHHHHHHPQEQQQQQIEDFEMLCNCVSKDGFYPNVKPRYIERFNSDRDLVLNRSFASLPKLSSANLSQASLDRKAGKFPSRHKHVHVCEPNERLEKSSPANTIRRVQSPEIINIHRAPATTTFYDNYNVESSEFNTELKCDDYGFRRSQSTRLRSDVIQAHPKRRAAGDGMDAQMDDPEVMFELTEHLGDCQCACNHMVYASGGYTTCLHQDDRLFAPAPDVTRRMGSSTSTILGKPEPPGSPPYYRSTSATSSSSNSGSSRIDLSTRHWWIILMVLLLAAAAGVGVPIALKITSSASFEERLEFATRLLQEVPLIDGHNDLPWNIRKFLHNKLKNFKFNEDLRNISPWSTSAWSHTDLIRLERGKVSAQFWAAYVPCDSQYKDAVQLTLEQIDVIRRFTELYQPRLTLCTSSDDIMDAHKNHQLCSLIGVEGGHSLAGSLAVLRTLYHVGVRYLTLTSTCNTPWADCSYADMPGRKPEHGGLTNFGKSVIKEMNRLGMIVDLSHVSVKTMGDALDVSKAPVIFSHSSAQALCNSTRNVPDATLRKLALNKGIIMVNFYTQFLTCKDVATVADAVAHINHIRDVAGVDNVGLGAGYDGINYVPQGLEDVSSYPTLFAELIATGKWTVDELKKLAGLNFLRVFQEVERIRDEFKKANVPPYEDVLMPRPKQNNCMSQDHF